MKVTAESVATLNVLRTLMTSVLLCRTSYIEHSRWLEFEAKLDSRIKYLKM